MARQKTSTRLPTISVEDPVTAWAKAVASGQVVAGPHVRNAARRHLLDLDDGPKRGLFWDLGAAHRALSFFPEVLRLNGGQFEGKPFVLHPSQVFRVGSLFGWKLADGTRRFRRFYDEEGKGNGKSPLLAGIGLYALMADGEDRAEVYAAGKDKIQAMVLFRDAIAMVRQSPALSQRLTITGGEINPQQITYRKTHSFFKPLSKEGSHSGPRPFFGLCDEIHEHPDRSAIEMIEAGFKFRRQPLLAMATNSGTDRNSVCWEEHEHAVKAAAGTLEPDSDFTFVGEPIADSTFAFVCALDRQDNPFADETCWPKANPLLGTVLTEDYLRRVVKNAKDIPGRRNGVLRLNFCTWTDAEEGWVRRELVEDALDDFDPYELHKNKAVYAGVDLSATTDMTAVAFVTETGSMEFQDEETGAKKVLPTFDLWVEAWMPREGLDARSERDKRDYRGWVDGGFLRTVDGEQIRLDHVARFVANCSTIFRISEMAYDNYAFNLFERELRETGITVPVISHPQAGKKRAKAPEREVEEAKRQGKDPPDGLWMPGSVREFEAMLLQGRLRIRRSPVIISAIMSATFSRDALDNRWFDKVKATNRIDAAVAAAMSIGAATRDRSFAKKRRSIYEERGIIRLG